MYTFYTDKTEIFECNISLQGAKLTDSKARLILESDDYNLVFYGAITKDGKCTIPVKKLKSVLSENTKGKVKLEVIAEDTYFEPWADDFDVETSKKVQVEVKSSNKTPIVESSEKKIKVTINNDLNKVTQDFVDILNKKGITIFTIKEHSKFINKVGSLLIERYNLKESDIPQLINDVIKRL